MTSDLAARHCVPCEGGTPPLARADAERYLAGLPNWRLVEGGQLEIARRIKRKDFAAAMAFLNDVAAIAEDEGHHPDLCISWNKVDIQLVTHAIGGLSENDFIMAAKIDQLAAGDGT